MEEFPGQFGRFRQIRREIGGRQSGPHFYAAKGRDKAESDGTSQTERQQCAGMVQRGKLQNSENLINKLQILFFVLKLIVSNIIGLPKINSNLDLFQSNCGIKIIRVKKTD